jgi:hypothetical protein
MRGAYHYPTQTKGPLEVLARRGLVTKTAPESAEIELYGVWTREPYRARSPGPGFDHRSLPDLERSPSVALGS